MHGKYAKGLDPAAAMGLASYPQAMMPSVFGKGFSPANPAYTRIASMPVAQLAMLSKGYKGGPQDLANEIGQTYQALGQHKLPSTQSLVKGMIKSPGLNDLFGGVKMSKAPKGSTESYTTPGYAYGSEPLGMSDAAAVMAGLVDAAAVNLPALTPQKYSATYPGGWGGYLISKGTSKMLKKKPGSVMLNRYVGRRLFR